MNAAVLAALLAASPEELSRSCARARDHAAMKVAAVATLPPAARTFANTAVALDDALSGLAEQAAPDQLLAAVALSSTTREAASDCASMLAGFAARARARPDLWAALAPRAREPAPRSPSDARLLEVLRDDLRRAGAGLRPSESARLKRLREREAELVDDFLRNAESGAEIASLTREELAGAPDDVVATLERDGALYRVPLRRAPALLARLTNKAARRKLHAAWLSRARANGPALAELLSTRLEAARLLGYESHADYVAAARMPGSAAAVRKFLDERARLLGPSARREAADLGLTDLADAAYARERAAEPAVPDPGALAEYFPAEATLDRALDAAGAALGIRFRRDTAAALWAPEARAYEALDAEDNARLGYLYIDLYARAGKRAPAGGSLALAQARRLPDESHRLPAAALLLDIPRPAAHEALLRPGPGGELEAVLEALGRSLAVLLARAPYGRLSRPDDDLWAVEGRAWGALARDPVTLESLSGRYDDPAAKAPRARLEAALAAQPGSALPFLERLIEASADQLYHSDDPPEDPARAWRNIASRLTGLRLPDAAHPERGFEPLAAAGGAVYAEDWARAYGERLSEKLRGAAGLDAAAGRRYRHELLERAGERPPLQLAAAWLGP